MKLAELKPALRVVDAWWPEWGTGQVQAVLKTRVRIFYPARGLLTYDRSHLQFLQPTPLRAQEKHMSTSVTKRRHQRNRDMVQACRLRAGSRVTVKRSNGAVLYTTAETPAFLLEGKHAMIVVKGIPGNTNLARVTPGWGQKDNLS